ncbi:UNVERIFIED_CONTAM: hypothetical protein Sradi_2073100 [Sesamum radiatum]|uniref:Uncharacterized protein n=1 Tax=Sesamum radiatum TaxID=300843 RepID=A0AAW2THH3_SESRA
MGDLPERQTDDWRGSRMTARRLIGERTAAGGGKRMEAVVLREVGSDRERQNTKRENGGGGKKSAKCSLYMKS